MVVVPSLLKKNSLILVYKARDGYYIQSLMKIVAIPKVRHFIHYTNIHGIIRHVYGLLKIIYGALVWFGKNKKQKQD